MARQEFMIRVTLNADIDTPRAFIARELEELLAGIKGSDQGFEVFSTRGHFAVTKAKGPRSYGSGNGTTLIQITVHYYENKVPTGRDEHIALVKEDPTWRVYEGQLLNGDAGGVRWLGKGGVTNLRWSEIMSFEVKELYLND